MNEIKQIRLIQLTASLLLQQNDKLKISQADSLLYDIILETPGDRAICLIRVVDDEFLMSDGLTAYMHELHSQGIIEEMDGNPLCLIKMNEADLTMDFQIIGWDDWGTYEIEEDIKMHRLTARDIDNWINDIRKLNHVVKILDLNEVRVIKHIRLNADCYGHQIPAEIVYLRDFSTDYKMNNIEPENEEEEREKIKTGHFQRQYPADILDTAIISAIRSKYPDADDYNSLLATNTDYRKCVGIKKHYKYEEAEIRIIPNFEDFPPELIGRIGHIEGLRFRLDIYIQPAQELHLYDNEGFELRLPMNNWIEILNKYAEVLKTMHRVNDLV